MLSLNQALRLPFTIPTLPAAKPIAPALALALTLGVQSASAISGGGLDYANLNLSESQDFAGKSFSKKDFSQIIAKNTNFHDSTLIGCRFYKAYLVGTDFSGADITGAALEDTSMDDANLNDAVAVGEKPRGAKRRIFSALTHHFACRKLFFSFFVRRKIRRRD
ncbi:hypothetical protein TL16_g07510 [Triparma laevis f. inornata]|uniref:Pentapeptide repeat-containing protein n=1 Tax=Triparma laevis f. inornata TaxID=1714386 RepID=A0A9W7AU39_9STRA|nr:hypothetical protein TL16_g07510 [Triparma laevis f. inornata]